MISNTTPTYFKKKNSIFWVSVDEIDKCFCSVGVKYDHLFRNACVTSALWRTTDGVWNLLYSISMLFQVKIIILMTSTK